MTERLARALEKRLLAPRHAQGIGSHHAHAVRVHVAQALAKALKTRKRARGGFLVDATVLLDARSEPHHLPQPIDNGELAVRVARDDHVKTVRSEIDSGENIGDRSGRRILACLGGDADQGGRAHPRSLRARFRPRMTSRTRKSSTPGDCESRTGPRRAPPDSRFRRPSGTALSWDRPGASHRDSRRRYPRRRSVHRIRSRTKDRSIP